MDALIFFLSGYGYWGMLITAFLAGSVFPFSSEAVMLALLATPGIEPWPLVLYATIGNVLGSMFNYCVGRMGKTEWIEKYLKIKREKMERAEKYFNEHGVVSTLVGRLIPVVRQLISIPAGLSKMNIWAFMLYTTIGAGLWHAILAALGWYLATIVPEDQLNDTIKEYNHYIVWTILALVAIAIVYFIIKYIIKKK